MILFDSAQDCLRASNGNRSLPEFVKDSGEQFRIQPIQAIITSFRFNCCGVITEWAAHVENSSSRQTSDYYCIAFQVWRPNSPSLVDVDGCYTMIGAHYFPYIVLDPVDRAVRETPLASDKIHVQPGDVIGFRLLTPGILDEDDGIQLAEDYTEESVWYATGNINSGIPTCPFPVGENRTLPSFTNLAPRITAAVCELINY